MKVSKFPQSCLVLEKDGQRIIIDPGSLVPGAGFKAADLLPAAAVLITHEHPDHVDKDLLQALVDGGVGQVIANASTAQAIGSLVTKTVVDGESFEVAGFSITARELPHVAMVDGSAGPQNTGFVIDGNFFHAGDGISLAGLSVEKAAIPFAGPDISPRDVYSFMKQLGCKTVIPIHYDAFVADPAFLEGWMKSAVEGLRLVIIKNGESAEV